MTTRTQEIAREILNQLSRWEDPADEAVLHAAVLARCGVVLASEFADARDAAQEHGWITGVRNALRGTRWVITDKGRAARHV